MIRAMHAIWVFVLLLGLSSMAMAGEKDYTVRGPDGVEIAVQESGDPAGPAIVFIHGLLGSHLNWDMQVASPKLQHYRLISYDMRGHGLSGKPDDAEAYRDGRRWADDLSAVLKATGAKKPVLVGWSRVELGRHTTGQVLLGMGVGAGSVVATLTLLPS